MVDAVQQRRLSETDGFVALVDREIKQHLTDEMLSLTFIAQNLNFNASYLSNAYKKKAGININEQISRKRMELANELLRTTRLSIAEISSRVGIPNYTTFIRLHKKYYHVTPGKYREMSTSFSQGEDFTKME